MLLRSIGRNGSPLYANDKHLIQAERIQVGVASSSLLSFHHLSALEWADLYLISIYIIFLQVSIISYRFFCSLCFQSFPPWRLNITFLDTELKKVDRNTQHNTHNTKSLLIRTLKYVQDIVAHGSSLCGERVLAHTRNH